MEKKTIAFLYNVRHHYPDPKDPRTQLEVDFDDPPAIEMMIKYLKGCGYNVIPIEADKKAYLKLYKDRNKIDLAFNYSEGIFGEDREAHIPAMLEMLQIPHTGPSPLSSALILNKAKAKEILMANNISTLPFQLLNGEKIKLNNKLPFPLIIKPVAQGSSAGITNASVVFDKQHLKKQVDLVINRFRQPALIEPFVKGREFSIAMLGNPPKILPIIEANHSTLPKKFIPIDSFEVKWIYEENEGGSEHFICPAKIDIKLKNKLEQICYGAWDVLNVKDWCRIDIRCDNKQNPYFLEINIPAGLIPPEVSTTSYFPLAARVAGIDYQTLLKTIMNCAIKRYEIN